MTLASDAVKLLADVRLAFVRSALHMPKKRTASTRRPGRRPAPELGERRRTQLLEAAFSLIAELGLEGLRTRDVAERAGVNVSTLHYYFGTKEALLAGVVQHASAKFAGPVPEQAAIEARGARGDVRESVREHLESARRTFEATPHLVGVMQELSARAQRDAATRTAFRRVFAEWNAIVEDVVRREASRGELRADVHPPAAARILTSFVMGAFLQLGIDPKAFDFAKLVAELERWTRPNPRRR